MKKILFAVAAWLLCMMLMPDTQAMAAEKNDKADLDAMIGQMVFVGFKGMDVNDPEIQPFLVSLAKGHVGGVVLYEPDFITKQPRNIRSKEQVRALIDALQKISPIPLFVAVDQEGGLVQRLKTQHGITPMPSAREMGKGTPEATRAMAFGVGTELRAVGINLNIAPVLDIDINPASEGLGAKERVYSADPQTVIAHAKAFAQGMHEAGLVAVYKHFPGQGSATADTHLGLSDITGSWSRAELEPYKALLQQNFPAIVLTSSMFNRNLDPNFPCSLSPSVVRGLLREELGWAGVTMSGDIQMKAVSDYFGFEDAIALALKAGQDIPLVPNNLVYDPDMAEKVFQRIRSLVDDGTIPKQQIEGSSARILRLKKAAGILPPAVQTQN